MRVLGIIPARGGSKGIPRKNIKLLGGKPLIYYSITEAQKSSLLTRLVISTEDGEIKKIAESYGADVPFIRPMELATDAALAIDTIQHAAHSCEKEEGERYDYVVMLQPTTPFRRACDIDDALRVLIDSCADSVISIVDVDNWHPMKMKRFQNDFLVDYETPPCENPPRQLLPKVYMVNGAIYASRRDVLMKKNSFKGDTCKGYIMAPEYSVNIDTEADFVIAEYYLEKINGAR